MINPYLIQRAKFKNRGDKEGIDSILKFDYMGSAEFEFGALPESLKRVRSNINDYVSFQYSFNNYPTKIVSVFCKKEQEHFVCDVLEGLIERKYRLKEHCDLINFIESKETIFTNDFWWDIENDWFFWKYTPQFDLKFIKNLKHNN
jgi:hypothetical protein